MWQVTPGTLGSSKSATHTLSLGERKLNVVLIQLSSSARAKAGTATKSTVAIKHSFNSTSISKAPATTNAVDRPKVPLANSRIMTRLRDIYQAIRPALDSTDHGSPLQPVGFRRGVTLPAGSFSIAALAMTGRHNGGITRRRRSYRGNLRRHHRTVRLGRGRQAHRRGVEIGERWPLHCHG